MAAVAIWITISTRGGTTTELTAVGGIIGLGTGRENAAAVGFRRFCEI